MLSINLQQCDLSQIFVWHTIILNLNVVSGQFEGAENDGAL